MSQNDELTGLSRRERQIMDFLFQRGKASVGEVMDGIPDPPGYSASEVASLQSGHAESAAGRSGSTCTSCSPPSAPAPSTGQGTTSSSSQASSAAAPAIVGADHDVPGWKVGQTVSLMGGNAFNSQPVLEAAPSSEDWMAEICGTPTPATMRVVQIEPGPMPTFTASAPASTNAWPRWNRS